MDGGGVFRHDGDLRSLRLKGRDGGLRYGLLLGDLARRRETRLRVARNERLQERERGAICLRAVRDVGPDDRLRCRFAHTLRPWLLRTTCGPSGRFRGPHAPGASSRRCRRPPRSRLRARAAKRRGDPPGKAPRTDEHYSDFVGSEALEEFPRPSRALT